MVNLRSLPAVVLTSILLLQAVSRDTSAQTSNATLGGTVSDATGALIPGVTVTARNVATGIVNDTLTNEAGGYQFPSLQTGTYEVSAELPGFRTQRFTNVTLGVAQQVRMNFKLQVADVATAVEVTAAADTTLATTSSSIGVVLPDFQVRELPTGDRNVLELLRSVAGTGPQESNIDGNFAGGRVRDTNITRDGFTVSAGRYNHGTFATTYTSTDLVEEVRITTGTVDAESGRGSGQVQMVTRSGTNDLRGSIFWNNRNSALDAASWFNNFNGVEADWENRNQFGARLGGPIIRNKTFFFFLIDEQRDVVKQNFVGTVLTNPARQGIFRYFAGADNANALQNNPTVDRQGNPLRPSNATGDLQSIDVFSYDSNRPGYDPTGWIQNVLLARMPQPNDWTVGDGLNTAGIRFTRRISGQDVADGNSYDQNNRDQLNFRLDHYFTPANKFSFVYTYERGLNHTTQAGIENWPGGYQGANRKHPRMYTFSLVSTFASNVVNELRVGYRAHKIQSWAPWYVGRERDIGEADKEAQEVFDLLFKADGLPLQVVPQLFTSGFINFGAGFGSTRGSWSPLLSYGDTISWIQGKHALKAGVEFRRDRTEGWNDNNFTPYATIGAGNVPAPITNLTIAGLTSTNATAARNLLYNLAGSIDTVRQGFDLRSSTPPLQFQGWHDGVKLKLRDWRANEFTAFFKDEWKATQNLTLNLGVQYEWYGVPYEGRGLAGRVVDGMQGLCGIACGALTTVELVGKNSPQPDKKLFNNDWNNFAPNVGFSWSLPGFGRSTILRGGYGISYSGAQIKGAMGAGGLDSGGGTLPGLAGISGGSGLTYTRTGYWSLANVTLPFEPQFEPLTAVPLTDPRTLTMNMYEPNRVTPYIQNFNLSIQRELARDLILDVSYVGSKGTKLYGRRDLNYVKIFETEFLEAFNVTRAGGDHPLFDRMLMGLSIPGVGRVNGTTITGSQALRRYTNTRTNLANGNAGGVASFLNTSTNVTGEGGGFIRNGNLPEDYLVFNPQFSGVGLNGNLTNSNYHSLQVQLVKRLSHGFTNQTAYTWSKALGVSSDDNNIPARDPRQEGRDKAVLSFHRSHVITSNGTYMVPFGPNQRFLASTPGWVERLVAGWQLGGLFRWSSGAPLTITAGGLTNIYQSATNTPHILGNLPEGKVTKQNDGSLPYYFPGLTPGTSGSDPGRASVTTTNNLASAYNRRAVFDAQSNAVLINPAPGEVGALGIRTIEGPARFELDMNLLKRVRIDERREFEFRLDVVNVLNHPIFGNPNTDINSASFGRISSSDDGRRFTIGARLNF